MFVSISWLAVYLKMGGWKERSRGLALVLEVTCHQSLQHFFSSGWLKGTEEAEGRGLQRTPFSLASLGLGMRTEKEKSWEVASNGWDGRNRQGKPGRKMACSPSSESPIGPDTLRLCLPTPAGAVQGRAHRTAPAASWWQWFS